MIQIAICEDDQTDMNGLLALVEEYQKTQTDQPFTLSCYSDTESLAEHIHKGRKFSIFVLDIIMPGPSGIALAKEIRKSSPDAVIIFISSSKEYALDAFGVLAQRYLLKPVKTGNFFEALNFAIDHCKHRQHKIFPLKTSEGIASVPFESIMYAECSARTIRLHCADGTLLTSIFIRKNFESEIRPLLEDDSFVQTHKSFAVNMHYIDQMKTQGFIITNGAHIPIARKRQAETKKQYLRFLASYGNV